MLHPLGRGGIGRNTLSLQKEHMMLRRSPLVERYKADVTSPPPLEDALLQIDDIVLYLRFILRHTVTLRTKVTVRN